MQIQRANATSADPHFIALTIRVAHRCARLVARTASAHFRVRYFSHNTTAILCRWVNFWCDFVCQASACRPPLRAGPHHMGDR